MKINKFASILSLFCILGFFSNTTGFDFYAHSTIYYYNKIPITHSDQIFDIVLPRYLFLSTLYEVSSRLGVPIGIITTLLITIATYNIFKKIDDNKNHTIQSLILISITFILSANYSALFISLLYILAFFSTQKKIFLIGGVFHPISVILVYGMLFVNRQHNSIRFFNKILIFLIIFFYISTEFRLLTSNIDYGNIRYSINKIDDIIELTKISFERKLLEFIIAAILALIFAFSRKKINKTFKLQKQKMIGKLPIIILIFMFTLLLNIYMWNKLNTNLPKSIFTANINDVIYISWFDWGEADIERSYYDIFNERLIRTGGLDD